MRFGYVWLFFMSVTSLCYGAAAQDPATKSSDSVALRVYRVKAKDETFKWSNFRKFKFVKECTIHPHTSECAIKSVGSNDFELWCYKENVKCTCTEKNTECTCLDPNKHFLRAPIPERWVGTGRSVVKQPISLLEEIQHARQKYPLVIAVCIYNDTLDDGSAGAAYLWDLRLGGMVELNIPKS